MLDQRGRLLRAAVAFTGCSMPSTTAPSTRSALGWTPGPALGTSWWACTTKATISADSASGSTRSIGRRWVTDAPPKVMQRYRAMLLERSPEERLKMGCSMGATARILVRASVLARDPHASPAAMRRALFLRVYSHEFQARGAGNRADDGLASVTVTASSASPLCVHEDVIRRQLRERR